ncbi:hypothetical protein [Spirosoma agri]|uniref:Uncharacterized protein n=1 Tax=Spirosoma agri TaxID=1987381 RepID=A0A6M0IKZ1_9BACT|nr:hypothetical protein [Spirosoma agri]NEU68335.1 hypothetical protein [Spirosoma agri]
MSYYDATVFVPEAKFKEMDKKISCQSIVDGGKCQTFMWQNEEWVATGAVSKGGNQGWKVIDCQRVVDLSSYKGELKPLRYINHFVEVDKGNRRRSYEGMQVKCGNRELVFVGPEVYFGQQVAKPVIADEPEARVDHRGQYKLFFA